MSHKTPQRGFFIGIIKEYQRIFYMSTLVNEQLYETCFDESFDEYMRISGLSGDQMSDWMRVNPFVIERIEEMAYKKFQDMCQ